VAWHDTCAHLVLSCDGRSPTLTPLLLFLLCRYRDACNRHLGMRWGYLLSTLDALLQALCEAVLRVAKQSPALEMMEAWAPAPTPPTAAAGAAGSGAGGAATRQRQQASGAASVSSRGGGGRPATPSTTASSASYVDTAARAIVNAAAAAALAAAVSAGTPVSSTTPPPPAAAAAAVVAGGSASTSTAGKRLPVDYVAVQVTSFTTPSSSAGGGAGAPSHLCMSVRYLGMPVPGAVGALAFTHCDRLPTALPRLIDQDAVAWPPGANESAASSSR